MLRHLSRNIFNEQFGKFQRIGGKQKTVFFSNFKLKKFFFAFFRHFQKDSNKKHRTSITQPIFYRNLRRKTYSKSKEECKISIFSFL